MGICYFFKKAYYGGRLQICLIEMEIAPKAFKEVLTMRTSSSKWKRWKWLFKMENTDNKQDK